MARNLGVGAEVEARGSSGRSRSPGHGGARHGECLCVCVWFTQLNVAFVHRVRGCRSVLNARNDFSIVHVQYVYTVASLFGLTSRRMEDGSTVARY